MTLDASDPEALRLEAAEGERGGGRGIPGDVSGRLGGTIHAVPKLFLPQNLLEEWALSEKADLREGSLFVPAENATFPLEGAVHFTSLASGDDDQKLLSKVKTHAQLAELSGEHMMGSVLLGETAYEVEDGFVVQVPDAAVASHSQDTDLLAAFLLQKP